MKQPTLGDQVSYWDIIEGPITATIGEVLNDMGMVFVKFEDRHGKKCGAYAKYAEEPAKGRWQWP